MVAAPNALALRDVRIYMPLVRSRRTFCLILGSMMASAFYFSGRIRRVTIWRGGFSRGVVRRGLDSEIMAERQQGLCEPPSRVHQFSTRSSYSSGLLREDFLDFASLAIVRADLQSVLELFFGHVEII